MLKIRGSEVMTEKSGTHREEFLQTTSDEETDLTIALSTSKLVRKTYKLAEIEMVKNREVRTRPQRPVDPRRRFFTNDLRWTRGKFHVEDLDETRNFHVGHFAI